MAWWSFLVVLLLGWTYYAWVNERYGRALSNASMRNALRAVIGTLAALTIGLLFATWFGALRTSVFIYGGLGTLLFFNLVMPWVYGIALFRRRK